MFVMLSHLFITALWSPEWKRLNAWLLFVMFIVILLLSHLVSWDSCATLLYRFLIIVVFLTLSDYSKIVKTVVLKTNGSLLKVESIAERSLGAFCNTFDLHLAIIGLGNQF